MVTKFFVASITRYKMPPEKARGGSRQSEVAHYQCCPTGIFPGLIQGRRRKNTSGIVYTTKLSELSGFQSFRIQSSHFKFLIQNLRRHYQTGKFFGFVYLCVNGKINSVVKRSGFVTNEEQFPLV